LRKKILGDEKLYGSIFKIFRMVFRDVSMLKTIPEKFCSDVI